MKFEDLYLRQLVQVSVVREEVDQVTPFAGEPEFLLVRRGARFLFPALDAVLDRVDALI